MEYLPMPKRNKMMLVLLVFLALAGFGLKLLTGENPLLGKILLGVGLVGFLLMTVSNFMLKRSSEKPQNDTSP